MKSAFYWLMTPFPSFIKIALLRYVFRWSIGRGVKIGFSVIGAGRGEIGDGTRIGHFNILWGMDELRVGGDVVVGFGNLVMGGRNVEIGDGALIGRFNEINSIRNPLVRGVPSPIFRLGRRAVITAWHKIDFTDCVDIGESAIIAGRLSNIWTHNRQDVGPVTVGARCYIGSGVQMVPRSKIGNECVVGLGAIVTKPFRAEGVLIAGVPARILRPLDEAGKRLVSFPTRPDLDGLADLTSE